ncbi:hypothetical protein JOF48_003525 [Arthrobacter stackebrandtii]|uniref:Uncharacterized protein n=1 Tax=Arthrobacter stackebrandtii TaxID=272161 RepID=A0ABS4Z163_9MICC|nr:hypothetical protein [Arthrobacter stackebrandtii]MBP2414726.1 hypothetical protein [Arthrobacter stackebrandtii]PYH01810.1 hypothetical protein CVV67_05000 [Arthrobacter stackebrandtii]
MNNYTMWKRLEPHTQTQDLDPGLSAGMADPLWMLLRQWQLGELSGDDGGSPVAVDIASSWTRFTHYLPGGTVPGDGADPAAQPRVALVGESSKPLEAVVEAEPVLRPGAAGGQETPWVAAVQAGRSLRRHLERHQAAAVADTLADLFPNVLFQPPEPSTDIVEGAVEARYRALLAGKVLDGAKVLSLLDGAGALPAQALGGTDPAAVQAAVDDWKREMVEDWGVAGTAVPAWSNPALEYSFTIAAPPLPVDSFAAAVNPAQAAEQVLMQAPEYNGTGMTWSSLDIAGPAAETLAAQYQREQGIDAPPPDPHDGDGFSEGSTGRHVRTVLPAPLVFEGMPSNRFWEFEDSQLSLGRGTAGPTDLVRMAAVDFATVFSPDWFLAPVELPVGGVARIDWVIVRDNFGVATLVGTSAWQASDNVGRMFQPSATLGRGLEDVPLLAVLPSALAPIESPPLEQIALQRDEGANMGWCIERRIMGPAGRAIDRPWLNSEFGLPKPDTADPHELVWRLSTPVAQTWTPLVAVRQDGTTLPILRKARILATETGARRGAQGAIMAGVRDVNDEEVTRSGIDVRITDQLARGYDGRSYVWRGRSKRPWLGEVSSGLRYDAATP